METNWMFFNFHLKASSEWMEGARDVKELLLSSEIITPLNEKQLRVEKK